MPSETERPPTPNELDAIRQWNEWYDQAAIGENNIDGAACVLENEDWSSLAIGFLIGKGVRFDRAFHFVQCQSDIEVRT